jgi:ribosomal protein L39E
MAEAKKEVKKAEKPAKEKKVKEKAPKKGIFRKKEKKENKVQTQSVIVEYKKPHVSKRQKGLDDKKATLAVKARQTKWAPVWVVMRKYGTGKRVHPSATTRYKRSWRRTKLHIKPRRIRKWHLG